MFCVCVLGRSKAAHETTSDYDSGTFNFAPECMFDVRTEGGWFFEGQAQLLTGGWSAGAFSLNNLYKEHKWHRNRWSVSNCGFDLTRYRGTTMYLPQHAEWDYIAFFDPEYKSLKHFMEHTPLHPIQLLTHPQTILIKSRKTAGPRRSRRIFIPPPAWWDSGWNGMDTVCDNGIFCYFFAFVDLDNPWLGQFAQPKTPDTGAWWQDAKWINAWDTYLKKCAAKPPTVQERGTMHNSTDMKTVRYGPFWPKEFTKSSLLYTQVTWFYKSYWDWGGNNLSFKTICDPCKPLEPPGS